ncbi:MAG: BamA/TamA family outer membrane protein [Legionellales bacterium]|nr:BamA/TamA family outer membrane protein [Legionellales bacterium]
MHATFKKSILWIDEQQNSASIHLIFDTGPQFYFGQIRFHPTYLSPKLLHRFVPFQWGQPYSEEQLDELNSNLAASGYFKTVKVKPKINNDTQVPVDIDLKPSKRVTYSLGAGYGTDTGPRGLAELHVIPVNRSGHKFNAILQGSFEENALQAQYLIPGKNPVVDNYGINGGITNLDYNAGHSTSELLSLAQQHVLTTHQRILSLNALHDRYSYYGQNPMEESLFYPKALFSWNHTSDPQFSPSGFNVSIMGLVANKALFSDITMGQLTLDAKAALTIDPIRTRLYFHTIQGTTNIHNIYQIPLSLAQLLGGATNLRGYNFNEVGPGRVISYAGAELQKETFNKWYALGFFDSGKVYNPQVSTYKYDAGVGVMWVSPVGPIKVAVAQAVNQQMGRQTGQSPKLVVMMGTDL